MLLYYSVNTYIQATFQANNQQITQYHHESTKRYCQNWLPFICLAIKLRLMASYAAVLSFTDPFWRKVAFVRVFAKFPKIIAGDCLKAHQMPFI